MQTIRKLKDQAKKNAERSPLEFKAVLGRADGTVKADSETVYVTLYNGNVITVYNERVPRVPYRKIIVGYDEQSPSLLQVLRFDNVYASRPHPNLPNHKESHTWFGYDPVEIYDQQIMHLLPRAIGGMVVRVYGGEYFCNGVDCILNTTDIDMSAEIPEWGAEWVSAEVDENGAITFTHGEPKLSREILLPTDIPLRNSAKKLLFSVKRYLSQTRIIQTRTDSDIFDPRFTGYASGSGGGYTPPATTAENDFQVGGVGATLGTWVKKTLAEVVTILRTALDSVYAPLSHGSHIPAAGAATQLLQWLSSGAAKWITLSGDATIADGGAIAVNKTRLNVRNETGTSIATTKAVYVSGFNNLPLVSLVDNTVEAKHNYIGITVGAIAHEANGYIATSGQCDAETNGWTVGTELYLSTAGALTPTEPTSGTVRHAAIVTVQANYPAGKLLIYTQPEEYAIGMTTGTDMYIRMGDSAGAKKISFRDYANAEVASINSDGLFTPTAYGGLPTSSLTVAGIIEIATAAETTTGTDATRSVSPDGLAGSSYGKRIAVLKCLLDTDALTTGDGKIYFTIPAEITGWNLVSAHAAVYTVSSSGLPTIQIRNVTDSADMLSTRITIDATEFSSYTATTAPVIDTTKDDVATGDRIAVDVDVAGTGTKGLDVILTFQLP